MSIYVLCRSIVSIKKYLYFITVFAALICVVTARLWLPKNSENTLLSKKYYKLCNLSEGCNLSIGVGLVKFKVFPASLPVLQNLQLDVMLEGFDAEHVSVEFIGRDMPMGLMPVSLQKAGWLSQHFTGVGCISFCTTDSNMVWIARLTIKTVTNIHRVDFELQLVKGQSM